jgi:hypothetical protein
MSSIIAGTVLGAGLQHDSDTTGNLVIKTGASANTAATFHGNAVTTFNGDVYLTNISTPLLPLVSGTANSSISGGTVVNFPNIPSYAKRITVMLANISTSSTGGILCQVGTGSTPTYITSGYTSGYGTVDGTNATTIGSTTGGFSLRHTMIAADAHTGILTLHNMTANTWISSSSFTRTVNGAGVGQFQNGIVTLGATLTAVRLYIDGTQTFDSGAINIMWE